MILYYAHCRDTISSAQSRVFLYDCLTRFTGELIAKATHPLKKTEFGKPYIEDFPLHFNLSHTDGLIICLVCDGYEVGVDCERVRANHSQERIAKRYFTDLERAYIACSDDPTDAFYIIWTLKEAYIKCTGKGLSQGLSSFSAIGADCTIADACNDKHFCTIENQIFDGYKIAACSSSEITLIELVCINM